MAADNTLSLYFKVRPGERAELEVVAATAIAWAEGLRAAARAIDAEASLRIELVDADEGSHIINTVLTWLENNVESHLDRVAQGGQRLPRTRRLAIALAVFAVVTGPSTYDLYFGEDDFSDDDRAVLQELLELAKDDPDVVAAQKKVFRAVERDPAITGLGVKETPESLPIVVIPSDRFAEGGGLWSEREPVIEGRTLHPILDVVLVKPALVHTPRSWTFKVDGLPEFEAIMKDPNVLEAMPNGLPVGMREGVPMRIKLEVREVLVDGEWQLVRGGRSVVEVISPKVD